VIPELHINSPKSFLDACVIIGGLDACEVLDGLQTLYLHCRAPLDAQGKRSESYVSEQSILILRMIANRTDIYNRNRFTIRYSDAIKASVTLIISNRPPIPLNIESPQTLPDILINKPHSPRKFFSIPQSPSETLKPGSEKDKPLKPKPFTCVSLELSKLSPAIIKRANSNSRIWRIRISDFSLMLVPQKSKVDLRAASEVLSADQIEIDSQYGYFRTPGGQKILKALPQYRDCALKELTQEIAEWLSFRGLIPNIRQIGNVNKPPVPSVARRIEGQLAAIALLLAKNEGSSDWKRRIKKFFDSKTVPSGAANDTHDTHGNIVASHPDYLSINMKRHFGLET